MRLLEARAPGIAQKLHYAKFCVWAVGWTVLFRPAWIYASEPLSAPIGLLLEFLFGRQVVYHEHDWPAARGPALLAFRRIFGRRADLCVLPNAQRAARFREETGRRGPVTCVWNCPSRDEVREPRRRAKSAGTSLDFDIYYHGNLGPPLLPDALFAALARPGAAGRLVIRGYDTTSDGSHRRRLDELIARFRLEGRVELLPPVSRARIWERLLDCHLGLALIAGAEGNPNLAELTGASNKVFDYLAGGLPVLVPRTAAWEELIVEPGYGLACDPEDPADIARAIGQFSGDPERAAAMGAAGRMRILRDWNYEKQFEGVLALLENTGPAPGLGH